MSEQIGFDLDASTEPPNSTKSRDLGHRQKQDAVDAWSLEDWESPVSLMRGVASPCRAARSFNIQQRQVADAVRAELQVDLEAMVYQAMDEIRSWVSEEIGFVRQNCMDELQTACVKRDCHENCELQELKQLLDEQRQLMQKVQTSQLDKLRADLDEQMRMTQKLQNDMPGNGALAVADTSRETRSSDRVLEAQKFAEERKWRLKLETLETGLEKHATSIEALNRRSSELEEKTATQDADIQRSLSASQAAEQQLSNASTETLTVRADMNKLAEQLSALAESVAAQSAELQDVCSKRLDILCKQSESLAGSVAAHEAGIVTLQQSIDTNMGISTELGEKSAVHEADLQELKAGLTASDADRVALRQCLETNTEISSELSSKSIAHETVIQELKADLAAGKAATVSLQNSMDTNTSELSNKSSAQSSAIQDLQAELAVGKADNATFQQRLDSNAKVSSDLSAELSAANSAIEELRACASAESTERTSMQARMDAMQNSLGNVCKCSEDLSAKAAFHESDILANRASIEDLKNDVSASKGEFLELKSFVDAQRNIVQSLDERCGVLAAADSCFEGRFEMLEREMATAEKETAIIQECLEKHNEDLSVVIGVSANLTDKASVFESQAQKFEESLKRLEPEVNKAHAEIAAVLDTLSGHGTTITSISKKHAEICEATRDLETELAAAKKIGLELTLRVDAEEEATERLRSCAAAHESEIKLRSTEMQNLETKLSAAECERLAELKVVCTKVEQQEVEIQGLSGQVRTQLRAVRQTFGRSLDEVRDGLSAKMSEAGEATTERLNHLESELARKISGDELEHTNVALHQWVNETRDALTAWLHTSLENFRRGQNATLLNHQGWVKSVTGWIKQVHVREQGLSHVLLHVLQDGKPELVQLLEDALRMPRVPNLESPPLEDAPW